MKIYLDHIGIACDNLDDSSSFWSLLGLIQGDDELVEDQGVTTRFFSTSENDPSTPKIELLEPTSEDTPIGKFLSKRGPGVQQVCFRVEDIESVISLMLENGIQMIDTEPRKGAHGAMIAFVHPKSTGGVLVELAQK
ncbi:MAG: methylmalonyl-CoA epimerase [Candidatus Thermoplasmatota archaeon]|nr:methylmalonyl-CoA epimerase [Candidatus Thermoplasmatota archaeon]MEC8788620.1 methylmalonyl-CoA epimerase [Candidatus Thermoplasmatota archaeon]|tara:strand:- start:813 stop:1223 length:411 start_codon:yes stop_codon:yes gene_type:complete